jgi:polysaccharide biosynthesis protein PslH
VVNHFFMKTNNLVTKRLRVLFFAPTQCYPPNTGAKLRNYHLARQLAKFTDVTYLSFTERSNDQQLESSHTRVETFCQQVIGVAAEKSYAPANLLKGLFGNVPFTVLNYTAKSMVQQLEQLFARQDFEVIQVESLLLSQYLPILRRCRNSAGKPPLIVCDWHNIDSEVMQRYSQHTKSWARRTYAKITSMRLAELEFSMLNQFDGHTVVSDRDRGRLQNLTPKKSISVIENGVEVDEYADGELEISITNFNQQLTSASGHRILFVGSMDYHANVDAVTTFAQNIWPLIYQQNPTWKFTIVGRNPSLEVQALANYRGIEVTGTVADVRPYYREAFASVVPLRIGGGSRLKILESLAAGVPVVSTKLGAEGLAITHRKNILIANSALEFCTALVDLKSDSLHQQLSVAGRELVHDRYGWSLIGSQLFEYYQSLIGVESTSRSPMHEVAHV